MTRALLPLCAALCVTSCYAPSVDVDVRADGSASLPVEIFQKPDAGPPEIDASACEHPPSVLSAARFVVTTRAIGYRFAPRNVGAIWIEDGEGQFVRALERWAGVRSGYLYAFIESAGDGIVDGVSGPTLNMHQTHEATWDLRDTLGCPVAPGPYFVRIELTDGNRAGRTAELPFELGSTPAEIAFPDVESFRQMRLVLE